MRIQRSGLFILGLLCLLTGTSSAALSQRAAARGPAPRSAAPASQPRYVGWELLSSIYLPSNLSVNVANKVIPSTIWGLDSTKVVITGYVLPFVFGGRGITEFALTESLDSCGYGENMTPTNWIATVMKPGKWAPYHEGSPIEVFGTLRVGATIDGGQLSSIYYFVADSAR